MLILLSPAKTLDYETPVPAVVARKATEPLFVERAAELIAVLRRKTPAQVAALMNLSDPLAQLNVARFALWRPQATAANSKPSVLAFAGDVYDGLDAPSLKTADLAWAQEHLVLLSGLYGALRPLDRLQPYRLEMGTALKTPRGANLYQFWGDTLAQHLNERLRGLKERRAAPEFVAPPTGAEAGRAAVPGGAHARPLVVNLASQEYAKAALRPALQARVVHCRFEDWKGGGWKIVSFFAKRARGLMARHAILERARTTRALQSFDAEGYAFDAGASSPDELVFRRRAAP